MTAGRCEDQVGLPADRADQRVVGGGVARVQGEHDVGLLLQRHVADAGGDEAQLVGDPQRLGHLGVVPSGLLLDVDADQPHRHPLAQPGVRGEGEVGVAAAEVDDPQRLLRRRGAQRAGAGGVLDGDRERPQELLDLAVLRLPRRLEPTLRVGDAERLEHRVVLGQQPVLGLVVRALWRRLLGGPLCSSASPFLVTRSWWVCVLVSTCQLANGSRAARRGRRGGPRGW